MNSSSTISTNKNISNKAVIFFALLLWMTYSLSYFTIKTKPENHMLAGYMSLIGEAFLDVFAAYLIQKAYITSKDNKQKTIFFIFFLSFIAAAFADTIYNILLNLYDFQYSDSLIVFIFDLPFALFLLFQVIGWWKTLTFSVAQKQKIHFPSYLPYFTVSTLIFFMFVFIISWKIEYLSLIGLFQSIDTFLEVAGFSLATLCLARSKNNLIFFSAMGYLLIIASDFVIRYNVITGGVPFLNPYEATWVLGLTLICLGYIIKPGQNHSQLMQLSPMNSLQSQIAVWLLIPWLLTEMLFFFYFFAYQNEYSYEKIFFNIMTTIIPLSILPIAISNYISKKLSAPIANLEKVIRDFVNSKNIENIQLNSSDNYIYEFKLLEKFTHDALRLHNKKNLSEIAFAKTATQVAHDIRSPLAAINIAIGDISSLSENRRILIKNASQRINDIAKNLLARFKNIDKSDAFTKNSESESELIFTVIEDIISEKKFEYFEKNLDIQLKFSNSFHILFARINLADFKRVLSNLINNSVEALSPHGKIIIYLFRKNEDIIIKIEDNGCGIPAEVLPKILDAGFSFNKEHGAGIGLAFAKQYIEQINGKLSIQSEVNKGTNITITLPMLEQPSWFCSQLDINEKSNIAILDDDQTVHDAWNEKLRNFPGITLIHLYKTSDFRDKIDCSTINLYLIDYELCHDDINGFNLINTFKLQQRSILVTSSFEDLSLRKQCENIGVKILPKPVVPYIQISLAKQVTLLQCEPH